MAEPAAAPLFALYLDERMVGSLLTGLDAPAPAGGGDAGGGDAGGGDPGPAPPPGRAGGGDAGHEALNRLVDAATAAGVLHQVGSEDDLHRISPGDLVVLQGVAHGNPLIPVLDFVATMLPLVIEPSPVKRRPGSGTGGGARGDWEQDEARRVLSGVIRAARDDLRSHPVLDVLMSTTEGLPVVLTCLRDRLGGAGDSLLRDRRVRVLAKVSAVLTSDSLVNLFRHSSMATAGPQASRDMLAELTEGGLELDLADPVITGPGLEVLPLAVLI